MRSVIRAIGTHIKAAPLPLTVHHCYRAPFAHCNSIANKRRISGWPPATRPMGRGAPVFMSVYRFSVQTESSFLRPQRSKIEHTSLSRVYLAVCSACWHRASWNVTLIVSLVPLCVSTTVTCSYSSELTPENAPD